jgi:hypothetical protein
MLYKRTNRKIIVLLVVSIVSMLIFANFDLTKVLKLKGIESNFYLPVPILFPLFFIFLYVNIHYIKFSYAEGKTYLQKVIYGIINVAITITIFIIGFNFWKFTDGDVDVAFFGEIKDSFELNFRNVYFWTFYQTLLMIYALSVLKILVSKLPKK